MKKISIAFCSTLLCLAPSSFAKDEFQTYEVDRSISVPTAPIDAREQWKDDRFGMFIHWGPISQMGKQLSHSRNSPSHKKGGKPYKKAELSPKV